MALQSSLAKFQNELSDATKRNAQHARPSGTAPARTSTPKPDGIMKRTHDAAFSSQPAAGTPAATAAVAARGSGTEIFTQVYNAVVYLKEKSPTAIAFDALISYLSLPTDAQRNIPNIKSALMRSDRATYLSKAQSGNGKESFKYRPIYPITNAEELKDYLGHMSSQSASGIPVKDLKDGWPDCVAYLDALEREGFLLITRLKKDNSPRTVSPDSPSYHILDSNSAKPRKVDDDIIDLWTKKKLPTNETDIRDELKRAGLTPTSVVKEVQKVGVKRKEKRQINRANSKFTNSHMRDILKTYKKK